MIVLGYDSRNAPIRDNASVAKECIFKTIAERPGNAPLVVGASAWAVSIPISLQVFAHSLKGLADKLTLLPEADAANAAATGRISTA